jgi:tryptophan synthase beta subunit
VFTEDVYGAKTYLVLTESGQWIGRLSVSAGQSILSVDDSHAVVANTGADGVVSVFVSTINRR